MSVERKIPDFDRMTHDELAGVAAALWRRLDEVAGVATDEHLYFAAMGERLSRLAPSILEALR